MRSLLRIALVVLMLAASVAAYDHFELTPPPIVVSSRVTKGDVVQVVAATGTLEAARTVAVGSQVTGVVKRLYVDYNAIVKKGQVLAEIDPQTVQKQLDAAEAAHAQAESALASDQAVLDEDRRNLDRTETLFADDQETLEGRQAAEAGVAEDEAKVELDKTAITTSDSNIQLAKVAIAHCTITSPIDGVVVSRLVDEGQTLNARDTAPTLYELASDLTSMQLVGAVDEADISQVHAGESARFSVEAYPGVMFRGVVDEVRLNAASVNNVVTYTTIINVKNPDLRLIPGMTARFTLETGRAANVLRVPATTLRFRPNEDALIDYPDTVLPAPGPVRVARPGSAGAVWRVEGRRLVRVSVTPGLTDGTWVEVSGSALKEGDQVISAITRPQITGRGSSGNPFAPRPMFGRGRRGF